MLRTLIPDDVISETVDSHGRRVVLLARVWRDTILIDHPELESFLPDMLRAVAAPDHLEHDPVYEDRVRYFARTPVRADGCSSS